MTSHSSIRTMNELLAIPTLQAYLPAFKDAGYDDLDFILTLTNTQLDSMIQSVTISGERLGIYLKHGHTVQILNKIRNEKNVRAQPFHTVQQPQIQSNVLNNNRFTAQHVAAPPMYTNTSIPLPIQQPPTLLQQPLNLRQLQAERDRRRQLKLLQKQRYLEPGLKSIPVEIDINKPVIDTGAEYVTVDINQYSTENNQQCRCSCYNILTRHYCYWLLLFILLLIIGIALYVSSTTQSNIQGIGTACIMFACCCMIISIMQFTRRHIHRSKFLDSIECCSICNNELDGVCAACSCGGCSCICAECTECTDICTQCNTSCKECTTDCSIWWSEFRAQLKQCTMAITTCTCAQSVCSECSDDCRCDNMKLCNDNECADFRIPNCTGPHSICAELGCAECSLDSCAGCCDDIECTDCNCDCLPDCTGAKGCFNTCIKIVCCQCKIQIA